MNFLLAESTSNNAVILCADEEHTIFERQNILETKMDLKDLFYDSQKKKIGITSDQITFFMVPYHKLSLLDI